MILDKKINKIETFQVKEILEKNGICVINNFIDISKIVPFQNEFNKIFDTEANGISVHANKESLVSKVIDPKKFDFKNFDIFKEIKKNRLFNELSNQYLKGDFKLEKIMIQKTKFVSIKDMSDKKLAFVPHTDETHFLKFFIYINDVDVKNGPFSVLPGSHAEHKMKRKKWISDGKNRYEREKVINQDVSKMISIVGKSGTLIIFDTDVAHRAGVVFEDQQRSIVRFDFFSNYENSNLFYQRFFIKLKKLFSFS